MNKNKTYQPTTLEMKMTVLIGIERKVHLLKWVIHGETQTRPNNSLLKRNRLRNCISFKEGKYFSANSADPDKMPHYPNAILDTK